MMDNRLLLLLSYLLVLPKKLSEDDKKALKSLLEDLREVYDQYDLGEKFKVTTTSVISCYNSLVRGHCQNTSENSVLAKAVERILAEKNKRIK